MLETLRNKTAKEIKDMARDKGIADWWTKNKEPLIQELLPLLDAESPADASEGAGPTNRLSSVVQGLEELFELLNRLYFENELPFPIITVQSSPRAYGHCTTKQIWRATDDSPGQYEINIGAEFLNRPKEQTAATMLHEMVHLYCLENGINDTSQNGRYHNGLFRDEMEKRDLEVEYKQSNGFSTTRATEAFTEKLEAEGYSLAVPFARITPQASSRPKRKKAHAYRCPSCDQVVRTTQDLKLICGHCEVAMPKEE